MTQEKAIVRMAAPAGINTSILPFEKAVANIQNGNYDGQRVMLIVKSPVTLVKMMEAAWTFCRSTSAICPTAPARPSIKNPSA